MVNITKQTMLNDRILYEGEVSLNYIFNEEQGIGTKKTAIPFNYSIDLKGVNPSSTITTNIEIATQDFVVTTDGEVEVKLDIVFNITLIDTVEINIIDDINEEENRGNNTCSLVIYYAKAGDTIWKIAKKFGSTMDEIIKVNGIENENKLNIGQQLFIPRYNG